MQTSIGDLTPKMTVIFETPDGVYAGRITTEFSSSDKGKGLRCHLLHTFIQTSKSTLLSIYIMESELHLYKFYYKTSQYLTIEDYNDILTELNMPELVI